ncbi:MAG: hypothetical protein ACRDA5_09430 [Clostridium sp.]
MSTIVKPGLQVIPVGPAVPSSGGSSKVKFSVDLPVLEEETLLLITLCLVITINGLTVSVYYSKIVLSTATTPIIFETILPNNAVLESASAYYDALYPVVAS